MKIKHAVLTVFAAASLPLCSYAQIKDISECQITMTSPDSILMTLNSSELMNASVKEEHVEAGFSKYLFLLKGGEKEFFSDIEFKTDETTPMTLDFYFNGYEDNKIPFLYLEFTGLQNDMVTNSANATMYWNQDATDPTGYANFGTTLSATDTASEKQIQVICGPVGWVSTK